VRKVTIPVTYLDAPVCPNCGGTLRGVFAEYVTAYVNYVPADMPYEGAYLDGKIDQGDSITGESDIVSLDCSVCEWGVNFEQEEVPEVVFDEE